MWFLIKGTFWFAAVLVVLSYFGNRPATEAGGAPALQVGDAVQAATEAYQYVSAICSEKPEVCVKGAETMSAIGVRATEGARVAFELLDKQFGGSKPNRTVLADPDPAPMPAAMSGKPVETAANTVPDTIATNTIPHGAPTAGLLPAGSVPIPQKRPAH